MPLSLDAWLLPLPYLMFFSQIGWWVIPSYLVAVLGIRMGHGRGFGYQLPFKEGSKPEKIERIIPSSLPVRLQKFLIMALTGLMVTLGFSLCLAFEGYLIGAFVLGLSGFSKSFAYFLPTTELAEYARGIFLGVGFVVAGYVIQ